MMTDYMERMKEEHRELCVKKNAANSFIHSNKIFKTLSDLEQVRLIKQVGFMEAYAETLYSRIWTAVRE
jgi:hypothetical protein